MVLASRHRARLMSSARTKSRILGFVMAGAATVVGHQVVPDRQLERLHVLGRRWRAVVVGDVRRRRIGVLHHRLAPLPLPQAERMRAAVRAASANRMFCKFIMLMSSALLASAVQSRFSVDLLQVVAAASEGGDHVVDLVARSAESSTGCRQTFSNTFSTWHWANAHWRPAPSPCSWRRCLKQAGGRPSRAERSGHRASSSARSHRS